jgi:hypothetical protein
MSSLTPDVNPTFPLRRRTHGEPHHHGLIVKMERLEGYTPPGILTADFHFQVPPLDSFPINRSYPKQTYDTIALEQRIRPGVVQLKTISYDTVFTDDPWSWTLLHGDRFHPDPLLMLGHLDRIGQAQAVFWLTARNPGYRDGHDVNMAAYLTDLNSEIRAGEPDARYVTVGFTEFKDSSLKTRLRPGAGGKGSKLPVTLRCDQLPSNRNTLYELSAYYYGTHAEWRRISKRNNLHVHPSYNLHKLGSRKITIPKRPS